MDADRFDGFVRAIGMGPRRALLGAIVGAAFASLGGRPWGDVTEAKKKGKRKGKSKKRKKKSSKSSACRGATTRCGQQCVDLATDGGNCGACGVACPSGGCVHSACSCDADPEDCPEGCACIPRALGGSACAMSRSALECDGDDDCPMGSFCSFSEQKFLCTRPCVE